MNCIMWSQKKNVILKLKKSQDLITFKLLRQIRKLLGQQADMRTSRQEVTIVYKSKYEVTTKDESLEKQLDSNGPQQSCPSSNSKS